MTAEMDKTSTSGASPSDLDKVLKLFSGSNSREMYERHVSAVDRLCRGNAVGFAIRDLPKVQQLLALTLRLLQDGQEGFLQPALDLLRTLSQPFVRRTSTDEFKMLSSITNMITAIAMILEETHPLEIKLAAIQTLLQFSTAQGSRPGALELAAMTSASAPHELDSGTPARQYHTNQSLVGRSGVIKSCVLSLAAAILGTDPHLVAPLAHLLLSFSHLADNCARLVLHGALQCLPPLLSHDFRLPIIPVAVELLWNIVEHAPEAAAALETRLPTLSELLRPPSPVKESPIPAPSPAPTKKSSDDGDASVAGGADADLAAAAGLTAAAVLPPPVAPSLKALPPPLLPRDVLPSSPAPSEFQPPPPPAPMEDGWYASDPSHHVSHPDPSSPTLHTPAFSAWGGPSARPSVAASSYAHPKSRSRASALRNQLSSPQQSVASAYEASEVAAAVAAAAAAAAAVVPDDSVAAMLAAALTTLLQAAFLKGHRTMDKELRNDVLVAATLLLRSPVFLAAASQVGFYDCVLAAATCPELGDRYSIIGPFALTLDDPDLELRLLSWFAATAGAAAVPSVLMQASEMGLLRVLLLYVGSDPRTAPPAVSRWGADQLSSLRSAALSRLHTLAPLLSRHYDAEGGPATLVAFLGACRNVAHLEAALRHLHHLVSRVAGMREILGSQGAIPVLLALVSEQQPPPQEAVRHFAFMMLAVMCGEKSENRRRFRQANGVQVLLQQLRALHALDPTLPSPRAVAVLDSLWSCVVPDSKSAARFLVGGGADCLLDLLERGNRAARPTLLGVLADIAENVKSHTFIRAWRSDANKQCVGRLLLSFWADEDALRGISIHNALANPARPLAGLGKRTAWVAPETVAYGNLSKERQTALQAVLEGVSSDVVLSKLYSLLKLLGFDTFGYLSQVDQAALILIEKYVKFRQGEIWQQIKAEFETDGMEPTETDSDRLASGIELSEHLATAVRESQLVVLGRQADAQRTKESTFYQDMRAQRRAESEARHYVHDAGSMTMEELRKAKQCKEAMLKASMKMFHDDAAGPGLVEVEDFDPNSSMSLSRASPPPPPGTSVANAPGMGLSSASGMMRAVSPLLSARATSPAGSRVSVSPIGSRGPSVSPPTGSGGGGGVGRRPSGSGTVPRASVSPGLGAAGANGQRSVSPLGMGGMRSSSREGAVVMDGRSIERHSVVTPVSGGKWADAPSSGRASPPTANGENGRSKSPLAPKDGRSQSPLPPSRMASNGRTTNY